MKGITRKIYVGLEADQVLQLHNSPLLNGIGVIGIKVSHNVAILKKLYGLLSGLSAKARFRFFFIYTNSNESDINFQDIGRFFLLANYYFRTNDHPLLILSENNNFLENVVNEWCAGQGFGKPEILQLHDFQSENSETNHFLRVLPEYYEVFFPALLKKYLELKWLNQSIIIFAGNEKHIMLIIEKFQVFHDSIKKEYPHLHQALTMITQLQEDQTQKERYIEYLQFENSNLKTFIKLLHDSNEVEHILNFYHTQYEVLPLWYKRFGHIIKILMGKRKLTLPFKKQR